ncbi:MAG: hypothetical protein PHX38_09590, partial [Sulfuricella sp.]|nr:hypothetical protein [Sulfuricella sp.]
VGGRVQAIRMGVQKWYQALNQCQKHHQTAFQKIRFHPRILNLVAPQRQSLRHSCRQPTLAPVPHTAKVRFATLLRTRFIDSTAFFSGAEIMVK